MAGAPGVPFALNPAQAITEIINFTIDSNVKLYKRAASRLSEDLFDCVPEDLNQFLKTLLEVEQDSQALALGSVMEPRAALPVHGHLMDCSLFGIHRRERKN